MIERITMQFWTYNVQFHSKIFDYAFLRSISFIFVRFHFINFNFSSLPVHLWFTFETWKWKGIYHWWFSPLFKNDVIFKRAALREWRGKERIEETWWIIQWLFPPSSFISGFFTFLTEMVFKHVLSQWKNIKGEKKKKNLFSEHHTFHPRWSSFMCLNKLPRFNLSILRF